MDVERYPVRYESATHLDQPRELVYVAAEALLARDGGRIVVSERPRHLRVERAGSFDELWLDEWGEGTGVRYKGGRAIPAGSVGLALLRGVARRAAEERAREIFAALRAALESERL